MSDRITCDQFQDMLDRHEGSLPEGGDLGMLRDHAKDCPDCRTLLALHRHLAARSRPGLEREVPGGMVDTMWQRVVGEIVGRRSRGERFRDRFAGLARILVPALSAAVVVLAFVSAYMYGELRQLRLREEVAVFSAEEPDRRSVVAGQRPLTPPAESEKTAPRSAAGEARGELAAARAPSGGTERSRDEEAPVESDYFTVADLIALLQGLDPETEILSASETARLLARYGSWQVMAGRRYARGLDLGDGLQADEAATLIRSLPLDPDDRIPRDRLRAFREGTDSLEELLKRRGKQ